MSVSKLLTTTGPWYLADGSLGPIDTFTAPYDEHFPDFEGDDSVAPKSIPVEYFNADFCDICSCIENMLTAIQNCCIRYKLYGPNSNTVIFMVLQKCLEQETDPPLEDIPDFLDVNPTGWGPNKKIDDCIKGYVY